MSISKSTYSRSTNDETEITNNSKINIKTDSVTKRHSSAISALLVLKQHNKQLIFSFGTDRKN